jgi:hypothetical protein
MIRVQDEPDLVRAPDGTIQNINQTEYQAYIARRKSVMETKNRLDNLEKDMSGIKDSLATILQLLTERK